jgi:hypothetical protein
VTIDADSDGGNSLFCQTYRLGRIEVSRIRESGSRLPALDEPRDESTNEIRRLARIASIARYAGSCEYSSIKACEHFTGAPQAG